MIYQAPPGKILWVESHARGSKKAVQTINANIAYFVYFINDHLEFKHECFSHLRHLMVGVAHASEFGEGGFGMVLAHDYVSPQDFRTPKTPPCVSLFRFVERKQSKKEQPVESYASQCILSLERRVTLRHRDGTPELELVVSASDISYLAPTNGAHTAPVNGSARLVPVPHKI